MSEFVLYPLYKVEALLKEAGYEISYAYDDLVFINHSKILIQFSSRADHELILHIHKTCDQEEQDQIFSDLYGLAKKQGTELVAGELFDFHKADEPDNVTIQFYN